MPLEQEGVYRMQYDDNFEAQRRTVEDSEKTYKQAASLLFPDVKIDSAYSQLKNCFNPAKKDKLSFGQLIALSKFCERADILFYLCDELGYERPVKKKTEDEEKMLIAKYIKAKEEMQKKAEEIQKISMDYEKRFYKGK